MWFSSSFVEGFAYSDLVCLSAVEKGSALGLTRKRMLGLMGATAAGSVAASFTSSAADAARVPTPTSLTRR